MTVKNRVRVGMSVLLGAVLVGCGAQEADRSLETGEETQPLVVALDDGGTQLSCPPDKALICHVPPGNPANEHTICVGAPAVNAHLKHHPDHLGPCESDEAGEVPDSGVIDEGPDGDHGDVDAGSPEVDAGIIIN